MATASLPDFSSWIGRSTVAHDVVDAPRVADLAATLDRPVPARGAALPEAWHWILFNRFVPRPEIGPDGHPLRGEFLPPVPLPRRMWAGGRLVFHAGLAVGAAARRESEILDVKAKRGRSGDLVFVTVRHRIFGDDALAISEEHDIVYRSAALPGEAPPAPAAAPTAATWRDTVAPDPVLLFRYSALTRNGHRIHYDHPYVTQVEGYPALIVHGPLIATFLVDLVRRAAPGRHIAGFAFRAMAPLFADAPFTVNGTPTADGAEVWATTPSGAIAMQATAAFDPA